MDKQIRCHKCQKVGHIARDCTSVARLADGPIAYRAGFGGRGGAGYGRGGAPQGHHSASRAPAYPGHGKTAHAPASGVKSSKYPPHAQKRAPPPPAGAPRSEAWSFLDTVYLIVDAFEVGELPEKLAQSFAHNSAVQMADALGGGEANVLPDADRNEKFVPVLRNLFAIADKLQQPNAPAMDTIRPEAQHALRGLATTTARSSVWKQMLVDVPEKLAKSKVHHTVVNHWVHICCAVQQRVPGAAHDALADFVQALLPNTPGTASWAKPLHDLHARLQVVEETRRAQQAERDDKERKRAADRDAARDEANRGPRDAPSRVTASILPTAEELATPSNAAFRLITRMPSGVEVASVNWLLDVLSQQIREDFMLPLRDGVSAQRDLLALGDRGFHSLSEDDRTSLRRRRMQVYAANNVAFTDHFPDKRYGLLFRFQASQSAVKGAPVIDWRKRFKEGNLVLIWRVERPKSKGKGKNKTTVPVPYMDQEKPFVSGIVVRLPGPKGNRNATGKFRAPEPIDRGEFAVSFADIDNVDVSALQKFFERQPATYHFVESKAFFVPTHRALIALRECNASAIESLTGPLIRGEADSPLFLQNKGEIDLATAVLTKPAPAVAAAAADGRAIIPIGQVDDAEACRRAEEVCEDWSLETEKRLADAAAAAAATAATGGRRQQQLHVVDETQREGLVRAFSHAIALIKGTPGTGKTFIGAKIVQLLSNNGLLSDGHPILVLTLTNHACDSFTADLLHYVDAKHIIRIGKASDDPAIRDNGINMAAKDRDRFKIKGRQQVHARLEKEEELFNSAKYRLIESDMGANNKVRDGDKRERNEKGMVELKSIPAPWKRFLTQSLEQKQAQRDEQLRAVRALTQARKEARGRESSYIPVHRDAQHRARLANALSAYAHGLRDLQRAAPVCRSLEPYDFETGVRSLALARPTLAETQTVLNDIRADVADADGRLRQQQQQQVVDALEQHFIDDWISAGLAETSADRPPTMPTQQHASGSDDDDDNVGDDLPTADADADADDDADGAALLQEYEDALDEDQRDLGGDGPDVAAPLHPGAPESMPAFFSLEDRARVQRWLELHGPGECRTRSQRVQAAKYLWDELRAVAADALNEAAKRYHAATLELRRFSDREDAAMLRQHRVIVGTTAGAMKFLPSLRAAGVRIIMVEEVGEVPEAHIVACITRSVEQLILIGDDRQLEPKLTDLRMERKGLGQSLMARVASLGIPHSTLTVQRRMHPDISAFVRNYYRRVEGVMIKDHPSTHSRAVIPGVRPECHYAFIDSPLIGAKEQLNPGLQSPENKKEADYVLLVAKYLLAFVEPEQIAVVTAYKAQLLHLLETAKRNKIPWSGRTEPGRVRFATVDDYQGEESDIVLLSLVRTESLGFLKKENRACVALSRARRLCVVFGSKDLLLSAPTPNANHPASATGAAQGGVFASLRRMFGGDDPTTETDLPAERETPPPNMHLWAEATKTCVRAGRLGSTFPAFCANHNRHLDFDLESFKRVVNENMGCQGHLCNVQLACGHACKQECHPAFDAAHEKTKCSEPCDRVGPQCLPSGSRHCDHPCVRRCYENCGKCEVVIDHVIPACGDEEHAYTAKCWQTANDALKPKCDTAVTRDLPCGHSLEAPCHEWPRDGTDAVKLQRRCRVQCGVQLSCGHVCKANCHMGKDHPRCMATCENYDRPCGHGVAPKFKCSEGPGACPNPCGELLSCGAGRADHVCEGLCGHDQGQHQCAAVVNFRQPGCSHTFARRCAAPRDTAPPRCKEPCDAKLACDHKCAGECGDCAQATATLGCFAHVPCAEKRDCALECGHEGVKVCSGESLPCTKKCARGCEHHKNGKKHKCGECPLIDCKEPCTWKCDHHKCTNPCGSPCDRPACIERCSLELKCGHQCSGVCGERCPRLCLECLHTAPDIEDAPQDAASAKTVPELPAELVSLSFELIDDEVEGFVFRDEVPEGVDRAALRLVELPECSHVFFASEIERALLASTNDTSGHRTTALPTCPKCRTPVASRHVRFAGTALRRMEALNAEVGRKQSNPVEARRQWLVEQQVRVDELVRGAAQGTFGASEAQLRQMLADFAAIMATIADEALPDPPTELPQQGKSKKEAKKANKDRMRQYEERVKRFEAQLGAARKNVDDVIAERPRPIARALNADNGPEVLQAIATDCTMSAATVLARQRTNGKVETLATIDCDAVLGLTAGSQALIHLAAVATSATQSGTASSAVTRGLKECGFSAALCRQSLGLSKRHPDVSPQQFGEYLEWLVLYVRLVAVLQRAQQLQAAPSQSDVLMPTAPCAAIPGGLDRWLDEQRVAALDKVRLQARRARKHGIEPFFIESDCTHRRCGALQRFVNGMQTIDVTGRWPLPEETRLAFHGTPATSVGVICCQGLDQGRRSGQVHGPGEYFGVDMDISESYARGAEMMIVSVVLRCPHLHDHGSFLVLNSPAASRSVQLAMPIGVVVYGQIDSPDRCGSEFTKCVSPPPITVPHVERMLQRCRESTKQLLRSPAGGNAAAADDDDDDDSAAATHEHAQNTDERRRQRQQERRAFETEVAKEEKRVEIVPPSRAELAAITKALGLTSGHAFACPNGHIYFIADCGGAMTEGKCPECGATVGGQNHRRRDDNHFAGDRIADNARPAWN